MSNIMQPMSREQALKQAEYEQWEKAFLTDWEGWIRLPTTQAFLKALDSYEQSVTKSLVADLSPEKPQHVYHHGVELKTVRSIKRLITDSTMFVARLKKEQ